MLAYVSTFNIQHISIVYMNLSKECMHTHITHRVHLHILASRWLHISKRIEYLYVIHLREKYIYISYLYMAISDGTFLSDSTNPLIFLFFYLYHQPWPSLINETQYRLDWNGREAYFSILCIYWSLGLWWISILYPSFGAQMELDHEKEEKFDPSPILLNLILIQLWVVFQLPVHSSPNDDNHTRTR